jgi:hypothetical protein
MLITFSSFSAACAWSVKNAHGPVGVMIRSVGYSLAGTYDEVTLTREIFYPQH